MYSIFAKAYEYKCGFTGENGIKCDGKPKLGELVQVCMHNKDHKWILPFPMYALRFFYLFNLLNYYL